MLCLLGLIVVDSFMVYLFSKDVNLFEILGIAKVFGHGIVCL